MSCTLLSVSLSNTEQATDELTSDGNSDTRKTRKGELVVAYIVCTLYVCFDYWKGRRSRLAVHLSGLLGDHLRVVIVK